MTREERERPQPQKSPVWDLANRTLEGEANGKLEKRGTPSGKPKRGGDFGGKMGNGPGEVQNYIGGKWGGG